MSIRITNVKAQVTIQDIGRWKFQSSGVPVSGPMDDDAMFKANMIVGNKLSYACMEVGMGSLEMIIAGESLVAVCGAGHEVLINNVKVKQGRAILLREECTIKLKPGEKALWSYMAVGGGISCPEILGSKSTYLQSGFGGLEGRALKSGDVIQNGTITPTTRAIVKSLSKSDNSLVAANWFVDTGLDLNNPVRITPGPEWNWLAKSQQEKLIRQSFSISNDSNRMGYRLNGESISRQSQDEMISSGVTKGTIQLMNDGSLIVLMADSQTVGGYPRVAQVAAVDIPVLAQRRPGTKVQFDLISHEQAERLFLDNALDLKKLEAGIRLKVL